MAGASMDIDSIIKGMSSPEVGANSVSVMEMIKELNNVLGELRKTVAFLDTTGLKPLLVRAIGAKMGVDAESPLKTDGGFHPKTDAHAKIYEHLNLMSETDLAAMFNQTKKAEGGDDVQT